MNDAGDSSSMEGGFFSVTEAVFSAAPVAIGLFVKDGRCVFANDAYAVLVGATKASLLAQNFYTIRSWQESGLLAAALRTLASGEPERLEVGVVTTTFGREIWARIETARISRGAEPLLMIVCNDLTDLKARERELVDALRAAQESNEAQSRFLASVSHELRTPLNAILGFSEVLGSPGIVEIHPSRIKEYADDIHLSAKYLLSLLDDLLDLARLKHGRYQLEIESFDVIPIIRGALTLCRHAAEEKQIALLAKPAEAHVALGDPRLLQQGLINILSNAVKFTDGNGRITVDLAKSEAMIFIAVTDTGIGIPADDLPHLGQAFRRVDHGRGRKYSGTGLGLAITKAVMERQGGRLILESVEGIGTTARLTLPVAPEQS